MQVTKADIADRLSILTLKHERLPFCSKVEEELTEYRIAAVTQEVPRAKIDELLVVNGSIWKLEVDIRQGKEASLPISPEIAYMSQEALFQLAEVGVRALAIRDLNGKRVAIKNEISATCGEFIEVKGDHASEPSLEA